MKAKKLHKFNKTGKKHLADKALSKKTQQHI